MSNKDVGQQVSKTAVFAALHRAIANKEFTDSSLGSDDLAAFFLPWSYKFFIKFKKIRKRVKGKFDTLLPGLHEYMIARTVFFDTLFVEAIKKETPQIVLIGAGYDSRAYRFAALNHGSEIFELDTAVIQDEKKKHLEKAKIEIPKRCTFVPVNFNKDSMGDVLSKAGYKNDQKTLFIWEGVSYYLDPESVAATLKFVAGSGHHETCIAFDYGISVTEETAGQHYGVQTYLHTMAQKHSNERFRFSVDEGTIGQYLEKNGLNVVKHWDKKEIEEQFLSNDGESPLGQINGFFRFVIASPHNK